MIAFNTFIHRSHAASPDSVVGRRQTLQANSPVSLEFIAGVTILTLNANAPTSKSCRALLRILKQIPMDRRHIVLDVSAMEDDDPGLPALVSKFTSTAQQCRLNACVAGLSPAKEAYFELTRVNQFVTCFQGRDEALCQLLMSSSAKA